MISLSNKAIKRKLTTSQAGKNITKWVKAQTKVSANLDWLETERGIASEVVKQISKVAGIKIETEIEAFLTEI